MNRKSCSTGWQPTLRTLARFGNPCYGILLFSALRCCSPVNAQDLPRERVPICIPESDPASPRKSKLAEDENSTQILRTDLDNDGDPDLLERWWNGKRCRWIDENDDLKPGDVRGDLSSDSLQIDNDGDGFYDGPGDTTIKWIDDDGDGRADAQIFAINPDRKATSARFGFSHYMVFIDTDHDGVLGYMNWKTFAWRPNDQGNWRTTGRGNYSPDYNGNAIFLKAHLAPWSIKDPRLSWENPFAFYDFDHDGCTEMVIRFGDEASQAEIDSFDNPTAPVKFGTNDFEFTGKIHSSFISFDLDNDSGKGNEFDFDMSMCVASSAGHPGEALDYRKFSEPHKIRAPQWVLDAKLLRFDNYRRIDSWSYVPHDKCYDQMWKVKWGQTWLVFDEDDDDHRWERVEMYYPDGDVYSTKRWGSKEPGPYGIDANYQADSLGDRGEWDRDNSGRGKLYVGRWDGKIHLYGAESGAWLVDKDAKYWGGKPVAVGGSSKEEAKKVEEVVQYRDTDNNGFIDEITYDYDGDKTLDLKISLLDYKDEQNPHPDEAALSTPADLKWQGLHEMFTKKSEESFHQALVLYRAAWKSGLTNPELDDLAIASSTGEKYDHGYWLKEKIFRLCDKKLSAEKQAGFRKAYFLADYTKVAEIIGEMERK